MVPLTRRSRRRERARVASFPLMWHFVFLGYDHLHPFITEHVAVPWVTADLFALNGMVI